MPTQIVIRLPNEQKTNLELVATQIGISFSELVRQAIDSYLQKFAQRKASSKGLKAIVDHAKMLAKTPASSEESLDINQANMNDRYLYGDLSPKFGHLYKKGNSK